MEDLPKTLRAGIRLERAHTRFVVPGRQGGARRQVVECEAERGFASCSDGGSLRFSGPPPRAWKVRLPKPGQIQPPSTVVRALATLSKSWSEYVELHYTAVVTNRMTVECALGPPPLRSAAVWALTGSLRSRKTGASMPLGWSGRGDGVSFIVNRAAAELENLYACLAGARPAESGVFDAVLAPGAAAVLLHEAVGHVAEAATESSSPPRRLPRRIAGEQISAADHALEPGGPAQYEYDDDNIRCLGPTQVVREGILVSELHSQSSAASAGALPTGNGRCQSVWHPPIPRFSNLVCNAGPAKEQDLIERVRHGLYIVRLANGVYNGAAVEADIVLAEWIRNGKRTRTFITRGRMQEDPNVLLRVRGVADNVTFHGNALCGKAGQLLFDVGTGAPSLSIGNLRIVGCGAAAMRCS